MNATNLITIEGSIYTGFDACLVRDGKTVAHVATYADAVVMAAAIASDTPCGECDGDGRSWNNADPTSGQYDDCVCQMPAPNGADMISVPRDLLAAACYCVRQHAPKSETYKRLSAVSLSPSVAVSSTPEEVQVSA